MFIYADESGDFAFPENRFDCYAQAVLICPDTCLPILNEFVNQRAAEWGVTEIHGHQLSDARILETCEFIEGTSCVLLSTVTDTTLITKPDIQRFRLAQAAANKRGFDRYRAQGGKLQEVERITIRNIKRVALQTQISDDQFVQAHFLILLIREALQKAVLWYQDDAWADDLGEFQFVLDGKLPNKRSAGEKYLEEIMVPALASRGDSFDIPAAWEAQPDHPFMANFDRESGRIRERELKGVVDLRAIFEGRVHFENSEAHAGLQLVDIVAHVVRRAVIEPRNKVVRNAYDCLRDQLRNQNDRCLIINRFRDSPHPGPLDRYRHVHRPIQMGLTSDG